jgi:hypothetical protein
MTVSDVGRMATGSAISDPPHLVTHATSGAKPSTWSFSRSSAPLGIRRGKYAFCTPDARMRSFSHACTSSHTRYDHGRRM